MMRFSLLSFFITLFFFTSVAFSKVVVVDRHGFALDFSNDFFRTLDAETDSYFLLFLTPSSKASDDAPYTVRQLRLVQRSGLYATTKDACLAAMQLLYDEYHRDTSANHRSTYAHDVLACVPVVGNYSFTDVNPFRSRDTLVMPLFPSDGGRSSRP